MKFQRHLQWLLLALLFASPSLTSAQTGNSENYSPEYEARVQAQYAEHAAFEAELARRQGRVETTVFWVVFLSLLTPVVISFKTNGRSFATSTSLAATLPNLLTVCVVFFSLGLGGWGGLKHPFIGQWIESYRMLMFSTLLFSQAVWLPMYIWLIWKSIRDGRISRPILYTNLSLWAICGAALMVFAMAISGLGSQGAGH